MKNQDGTTKFNEAEKNILDMLRSAKSFKFNGVNYDLEICEKPKVEGGGGETKTDIYISAKRKDNGRTEEIKITYKKPNFSFVENKISAARAEKIYGKNWSKIIKKQIGSIQDRFLKESLVYFRSQGNTEAGSIKIGWRYEMEYKGTRNLGVKIDENISAEVWRNKGADIKYTDAQVNGVTVALSGIPNYYLEYDPDKLKTASDIYSSLKSIDDLARSHAEITAAFLAQNYRSHKDKQEGDSRDMAVWVDWKVANGKLKGTLVFDDPLQMKSGKVLENLKKCLDDLGTPIKDGFNIEMLRGKTSSDTITFD